MRKKVAAALLICLGVLMQGCASNGGIQTPKTSSSKETNSAKVESSTNTDDSNKNADTDNNSNEKSSSNDSNKTVSNYDYSKYSGNWIQETSLKSDFKYGTSVTIKVDKYGNLSGSVGSLTENASHVANVDIKGKIQNDQFTYNFKDDNWGHNGTIKLKFQNNQLILNMAYGKGSSQTNLWGIGEGTFTLVKDTTKVNRTLSDLKNGGLQVIESQCFNVNLKNYGQVKFVSGLKRENANEIVQFYLIDKNNNVLYKFNDFYGNEKGKFKNIAAVSFSDVNNDGAKDIVIIANYYTGGSNVKPIGSIYFSKGKEFVNDRNLDDKINKSSSNKTISSLIKFAKSNLSK